MLTYRTTTEIDYRNEISELYHIFSDGKKVASTIDDLLISNLVVNGLMTKED